MCGSVGIRCSRQVHVLELPDVLPAFLAWVSGRTLESVQHLVNTGARLMPNALRVGGWSHSFGGIMKRVAELTPDWPTKIGQMRTLCRFFKNEGYRKHIGTALAARLPGIRPKLRYFTASFAKWRYETVSEVLRQLVELRELCEGHMSDALFPSVQEKDLLRECLLACRDKDLWRWMAVAYREIFQPLEQCRRWGMICACHYPENARSLPGADKCPRRSRRLHEVESYLKSRREHFTQRARDLRNDAAEGSGVLREQVCCSLMIASSDIELRFRYLTRAPWSFVHCDRPEGASRFLQQVERLPLPEHDPLTQRLVRMHRSGLEQVAGGSPCPQNLQAEVDRLRWTPLDESAGEGYHRSTHNTRRRAPAATIHYIKQDLRVAENLRFARSIIRDHGARGKAVFDYEWRHWKRVLQTDRKKYSFGVKMKASRIFDRIYRVDEMSYDDWSSVVSRNPAVPKRAALTDQNHQIHEACATSAGPFVCDSHGRDWHGSSRVLLF